MNICLSFISSLLVLSLLSSCFPSECSAQRGENPQKILQSSEWLFLVYLDADNNLATVADINLAQMMAVGSDSKINILVLLDKNSFGDSVLYYVKKNALEVVDDGGAIIPETNEVNMGSPETLRNFLNFSRKFQRDYTFLVLWDHGSGWKGFCTDSESRDSLNLSEIAGVLDEFDIDVLGIDACQGALVEVVYALRNSAKYFVGSQKDEPESGWNYTLLLNMAKAVSPLTPEKFAVVAVDAFEKNYKSSTYLSVSVALSAIDLRKVEMLCNAIDNFTHALSVASFLLHGEIFDIRNSTETYEGNNRNDVDFGDFVRKSLNSSYIQIRREAKALLSLLNEVVLKYCGITSFFSPTGVRADNASGLSIYFPVSSFDPKYLTTAFAMERNWSNFLLDFLEPPALQVTTLNVNVTYGTNTIFIENPNKATIYICDSTGEVVKTTNETQINYTVSVADYYEVFAYNTTSYNGKLYLDGMSKTGRKWVGERKPNIKIASLEFFREDGARILGDTNKHPIENRTFELKLEIANDGNVNVTTLVIIEVGNFSWQETIALEVNSSLTLAHSLSLPFGEFKIRVVLDPYNSFRETNETDNFYFSTFWVKSIVPLRGITLVLRCSSLSKYLIYNETGALIAEGQCIGSARIYIHASSFKEGSYLYIHLLFGDSSIFRKIQVFSEDEKYELTFSIQKNGFSLIDYIFLASVTALVAIFTICLAYVLLKIRKKSAIKKK